jgi:hypothetical protein
LAATVLAQSAGDPPSKLRPAEILALQRTVGNQAVQRTIARRRARTVTREFRIRSQANTRLPPSTVARVFGPARSLTPIVEISYDPATNQIRMSGSGGQDYLREHARGVASAGELSAPEEGGFLTVDISQLDDVAQREISGLLGVDLQVLTGTRPAPPEPTGAAAAGSADALLVSEGEEWNGETILNQLTQIDQFRDTLFDRFRCGPTSALAVHILAGFEALRNVAESIRPRVDRIRTTDTNETIRSAAATYLRGLQAFTGGTQATVTYRHLSLLADALFLVVRYDRIHEIIRSGEDREIGTREQELAALSGVGHAQVSTTWPSITNWFSVQFGGEARVHGGEAISRLPPRGERLGMGDFRQTVGRLESFRLVSLIVAVPTGTRTGPSGEGPYIEEGTLTHYVALGADGRGRVFVYDPYPRVGSQLVWVRGNEEELESYFMGRWRINGRIAAASARAEGPESGVIDIDAPTRD